MAEVISLPLLLKATRRILVENARRRHRVKRGGHRARVDLDKAEPTAPETDDDLLALDEALERLAEKDSVKAQLVQLRVFAGLTVIQAAEILGLSTSTADRYWAYARGVAASRLRAGIRRPLTETDTIRKKSKARWGDRDQVDAHCGQEHFLVTPASPGSGSMKNLSPASLQHQGGFRCPDSDKQRQRS